MGTRLSFVVAAVFLFAGCTRVAFRNPVGKTVEAADQDQLVGAWTGEKGIVWTVDRDPKSDLLRASWEADGKAQSRLLVLTTIGENVNVVWEKEDDLAAYVPLRISGAEEALALLYPSDEAVKKLVADGKLAAVFDRDNRAWILPDGDGAALLQRTDFWRIDACMPFVRNARSKVAGGPAAVGSTLPAGSK
ncbi:MAG TPA: hypothetical protein VGF85_08160 [Opitutaceae bacterium]|jgi:hypothetical protein